jgi:hypothetical protein
MRYDLHVHTSKSGCSNLLAETILKTAKKRKLDGIAVVDHNTIEGALKVKKLNKDRNFEVIVGAEIKTDAGEVIGLYLKEEIKSRKLNEVIDEIRKQNGIVIIPHPFSRGIFRKGLSANLESIKNKVDAIEAVNGRCLFSSENRKALKFAEKFNLAKTAGSDAHFAPEIGKCYTEFEGELRKSLNDKTAKPFGRIGFSLFWRGLSFLEKYFVKRLRCQKCSFDLDWLE